LKRGETPLHRSQLNSHRSVRNYGPNSPLPLIQLHDGRPISRWDPNPVQFRSRGKTAQPGWKRDSAIEAIKLQRQE